MMSDTEKKLLLDAAYEWERNSPNRIYMTQPLGNGETIDYTWAQTMDQARRMAAYLRSLDLPENSHIALISKNCAHFILSDLAIWMAGHVSIALYPTLNADSVSYILDHSESKLVFVGKLDDWDSIKQGIPDDLPKIALPLAPQTDFLKWDDIIAQQQPIADNPSPPGDQLALMCYTSGSTGKPKGVMHSFASAATPAQLVIRDLGITSEDRVLSYLPLAHVMERAAVECGSFFAGTHIYFAESLDTFLQDLQRARPTVFLSVPRLWLKFQLGVFKKFPEKKLARLLKIPIIGRIVRRRVLEGLGLAHVRLAGSGSAPIPADLIRWYETLGLHLLEGYGMSEDFAYSHMSTPQQRKAGYVGVPGTDVETRIGEGGEIQIKSPGNMLGYHKAPELTAECYTPDGYFRTGDIGEYSPEGLLKVTGRTKELFKTSKGKYVSPAPIENLLNNDNHIELSCVSGSGRPACHGVLQLAEDLRGKQNDPGFRKEITPKLESLLRAVNEQIEEYEVVLFLVVAQDAWDTENNFLTPTLKIKRNEVEAAYDAYQDDWYASGSKVIWQD
jgi:long-chain acyl-CoA synthetase